MIFFLINFTSSLSWRCQFDKFGSISTTHFLYKEDNVNEVKWLEKYEYCRAKGDRSVYNDAGQRKCEYSRGLCYWNNGFCENTNRANDPFFECQDLINNNNLVEGLDNGRKQQPVLSDLIVVNVTELFITGPFTTELSKETRIVSSSNKLISSLRLLFMFFFININ